MLINNAGIMPTRHTHEEDDAVTRRQVEINVLGVIFGTKLALQRMLPRRTGHTSTPHHWPASSPSPVWRPTAAPKFAVIGFTEAARLEYRKSGVRLSTVRPRSPTPNSLLGQQEPRDCAMQSPRKSLE